MRVIIINGVNLNMLGVREPDLYGNKSYKQLVAYVKAEAKSLGIAAKVMQSNSECKIVEAIQKAPSRYDGIIINAGAYTHTSIAILDALKCANLPTV